MFGRECNYGAFLHTPGWGFGVEPYVAVLHYGKCEVGFSWNRIYYYGAYFVPVFFVFVVVYGFFIGNMQRYVSF